MSSALLQLPTPRNRVIVAVRWLSILPASLIGAWLAWFVVRSINVITFRWQAIDPLSFWGRFAFETTAHLAMGIVGVWCAGKIAPKHKAGSSFAFGVLYLVIAGVFAFPAVMVRDWWAFIGAACIAIGASSVMWAVHTKQLVFDASPETGAA